LENTIENRRKLFALYFGQKLICNATHSVQNFTVDGFNLVAGSHKDDYLELRPLSSITDEESIEIGRLNGSFDEPPFSYSTTIQAVKESLLEVFKLDNFNMPIHTIDYLRSKGFAIPFNGLSVEKQIEYGWIKLT